MSQLQTGATKATAVSWGHFTSEAQAALARLNSLDARDYPGRAVVAIQGTVCNEIYVIRSGFIGLRYITERGDESLIGIRPQGSIIGCAFVLDGLPWATNIEALSHASVTRVSARTFRERLESDQGFNSLVHQATWLELRNQTVDLSVLSCSSARRRLEHVLWTLALMRQATPGQYVQLPVTQAELAQLVHVTPQYLSVLLAALEEEKRIVRTKSGMIVEAGHLWHLSYA